MLKYTRTKRGKPMVINNLGMWVKRKRGGMRLVKAFKQQTNKNTGTKQ